MINTNDSLVRDLIEWVDREPRAYVEVIDAWRTSCPRLTIWEDAVDRGFVERRFAGGRGVFVHATPEGLAFLSASKPG